jgi:hypothetical protein
MPQTSPDALIGDIIGQEQIAPLAVLYDRFAHALDPLSQEVEQAEKTFLEEIAEYYDLLQNRRPDIAKTISQHEFRKAVILRCKRHLIASDKKSAP